MIVRLLQENSSEAEKDVDTFVASLALHWVTGAPDAHAKNYSVLITSGAQTRLAPLYDLLSVVPYPDRYFPRKIKLALQVGGEYRAWYISPRHWTRFAEENGLNAERVHDRVHAIVSQVPDCLAQVCAEARNSGLADGFVPAFQNSVTEHAKRCLTVLEKPTGK